MFLAMSEMLIDQVKSSNKVYRTEPTTQGGFEEVISVTDLFEIIQQIDDSERERILAGFKEKDERNKTIAGMETDTETEKHDKIEWGN